MPPAPTIDISVLAWDVQNLSYQQYHFLLYVVVSKCYRHHVIYEKYETLLRFKLHFLQNIPSCKYTLLPTNVKVLEIFLEDIL